MGGSVVWWSVKKTHHMDIIRKKMPKGIGKDGLMVLPLIGGDRRYQVLP